jgi:glutathione synthase/RimK-type ligase-like ATP-grasp enzyme
LRTILNGHSGAGIVICDGEQNIPEAPLYTKYIKKDQEYRIHVCKDKAFFVQRKARKLDVPDELVNWQVRNHQNGFIYANQNIVVDGEMLALAVEAVRSLELDFGAVDIITEKKSGKAYVLEVNTAPGLSGATLDAYVQEFKKLG